MPEPRTQAPTLCEPAQSKRTSTFHKSHFTRKFTRKVLEARPPHFARACAIEMHFNISQKPLYTEIYRKNAAPQIENFVRACALDMHVNISEEPLYTEIYQVKCHRPNPRPTLWASLRSRNAFQHVTRATLYPILREKCSGPEWAPWSSTGLYTYRKNPSVWTQCLGRTRIKKYKKNIYNHEKINVPIWLAQRPSSGKRKSSVATPTSGVSGMDGAPQVLAFAKVSHGLLTVSPVGPWPAVLNPAMPRRVWWLALATQGRASATDPPNILQAGGVFTFFRVRSIGKRP